MTVATEAGLTPGDFAEAIADTGPGEGPVS